MTQNSAEPIAVAAASVATERIEPDGTSLSARCTALRSAALANGLSWTPEGRSALAGLLQAAQALELELAEKAARIRHLENLSVTDELTGLFNRRGFGQELDKALARARRTGETGVLALIDLDHFKPINDTYGHHAGDQVLITIGRLLASSTRTSDATARLGGDEFAVLLTDAAPHSIQPRISCLREVLSHLVVGYGQARIPVYATLGCAPYGPSSDAGTLTRMADAALYRAKSR